MDVIDRLRSVCFGLYSVCPNNTGICSNIDVLSEKNPKSHMCAMNWKFEQIEICFVLRATVGGGGVGVAHELLH